MNRFLLITLMIVPILGATLWTIQPSFATLLAVRTFQPAPLSTADANDPEALLQYKRDIQRHFAGSSIHVPLEDIAVRQTAYDSLSRIQALNSKACGGKADLFLWLPLRFRLPVVGEIVFDRCWTFFTTKGAS